MVFVVLKEIVVPNSSEIMIMSVQHGDLACNVGEVMHSICSKDVRTHGLMC
mgnify:CR=1 FL=1